MDLIAQVNGTLNGIIWNVMMFVLLGTGLLLTIATRGVQFRKLGFAFREVLGKLFSKDVGEGSVRPFQALSTALASTVGVGNIAGVATAIELGGPGALFWLLISGLLGMSTKFAEIAVALYYRERDSSGTMRGGAMYVLKNGLRMPWLGSIFALLTAIAGFGLGNMVQANSVADTLNKSFGVEPWLTGVILAALVALVILGGIQRIAEVTQFLVPFMCVGYVVGTAIILIRFAGEIPGVVQLVLHDAFSGQAAMGGFVGASVKAAMSQGIKKGLFSNEAGLGSAPMVHASAVTDHPVRQATYGIFEVFVDSVVICVMTGLVVLSTGAWQSGDAGAAMSAEAFAIGLPGEWGHYVVTIAVLSFAFSTLLGFSYYGETAVAYLFGSRATFPYRLMWTGFVYIGAIFSLHLVWDLADTLNALMALPNLVGVLGSLGLLLRLMNEFFAKQGKKPATT